jgi:hypothetical protein
MKVKGGLLGKRKRKGKGGGIRGKKAVTMIKVHYMHVWKYLSETPLYN